MPPKREIPRGISMKDPDLQQATKEAGRRLEAAKQADISISSRLLTLAKIVPQTGPEASKTP